MARKTTETRVPDGPFRTLRFRGIETRIDIDGIGEYVEMLVPTKPVPDSLHKGLLESGLSDSQREEIYAAVAEMAAMNYLLAHQDK